VSDVSGEKIPPQLLRAIVQLSLVNDWSRAKLEWRLSGLYFQCDPPGTCLCGHYPIHNHCVLVNRFNRQEVTVGSCCAQRFLGIDGEPLFRSLKRLIKNPRAALSKDLIRLAYHQGILTDWEINFYLDSLRYRWLSPKQQYKRQQINLKVLRRMAKGVPYAEG
jgi:hypothetical protein